MSEPERTLAALAAEIDWPVTPELSAGLAARLAAQPPSRPIRRRTLAFAVGLVLLAALAAALAVPSARTSILRFFHLGGATVEIVDTLPPAQDRSLTAGLGRPVARAQAERDLGFRLLLPPLDEPVRVYEQGTVASVVLESPKTVLLSELGSTNAAFLKKLAGQGTAVQWLQVNGEPGIWISGREHVFSIPPAAPPRLAGNVLLWQHGRVTLRLEGNLTREEALSVARSVR